MTRRRKRKLRRKRDESRLLSQLNEIPVALLPVSLLSGDMQAEMKRLDSEGMRYTIFEHVGHVDEHMLSASLFLVPHAGHMPTRAEIRTAFNKLRALARKGEA